MGETVVLSASDCLSPVGKSLDETWKALAAGASGVRRLTRYKPDELGDRAASALAYGGEIPMTMDEIAGSAARLQKWVEPGYHAARTLVGRALYRLGFDIRKHDPQRIALLSGTVLASQHARAARAPKGQPDARFMLNQCPHVLLGAVASEVRLQGPSFNVASGCASGAHAVYLAAMLIRANLVDAAVVVAHEFPHLPEATLGMDGLGLLYRREEASDRAFADPARASRPFSRDRRGFVLSEGAAVVVMASAAYAEKHSWPRLATIRGAFTNSDADHPTRPSTESLARCMRGALSDAWIGPDSIECIHAHATSTPAGDRAEMSALHEVFGPAFPQVPVVALKAQLGHTLGASGLLTLTLAMRGMAENTVLPTLNHDPDPTLPQARLLATATERRHKTALVSSFGFGGTNVSLVLQRGPDARATT